MRESEGIMWSCIAGAVIWAVFLIVGHALLNAASAQTQSACTTAGTPTWCVRVDMTQRKYFVEQCNLIPSQTFDNLEPALQELARLEGKTSTEVETCSYDKANDTSYSQNQCASTADGLIRPKLPTEACQP